MLAAERRDFLLDRLKADGKIIAREAAEQLGLSEDSVRRDLRELAAAGLCQRVYGGALPASRALVDYPSRADVEPDSKHRVAVLAATMIRPGTAIILDGGTTTLALVHALDRHLKCTVITHSPTIAAALLDHGSVEVLLLGGRLLKHSAVTCGAAAVEAALKVSADMFFLGVTGIHAEHGLTTGDVEEAAMKRALAGRAAETFVLASADKLGSVSRYQVLPFEKITAVITDAPAGHPITRSLQQHTKVLDTT